MVTCKGGNMNYWFTSDPHYGHGNIIKYCKRPFKSVEEMNKTLIKNHNERVKPEDMVFMAGDFCFRNSPGGKEGEGTILRANDYLNSSFDKNYIIEIVNNKIRGI